VSKIKQVGFEIEGGWAGTPGLSPRPRSFWLFVPDQSINGQTLDGGLPINPVHLGEAIGGPFPYQSTLWESWLLEAWPDAPRRERTNITCGFHIHISTHTKRDYCLLTAKSFLSALVDLMWALGKELKLPEAHPFWWRLGGDNRFCRLGFNALAQMAVQPQNRHNNATRYGMLNFSQTLHGTMEFRLLPTFRDAVVGLKFATAYLAFVEAYLTQQEKTDISYSTSLSG
jgi:hypothetical protein